MALVRQPNRRLGGPRACERGDAAAQGLRVTTTLSRPRLGCRAPDAQNLRDGGALDSRDGCAHNAGGGSVMAIENARRQARWAPELILAAARRP
ncbi:hypothetical protein [Sorangium sp. So ce204]|uniref:hypothetical protein n=1 Tax=Sorangium sp. So ce204 TaxID=3133288 RepID=UPI003F5E7534